MHYDLITTFASHISWNGYFVSTLVFDIWIWNIIKTYSTQQNS